MRAGTVYPRVCGGTPPALRLWMTEAGLSPRVRGNPAGVAPLDDRGGSIPACAGEPEVDDIAALNSEVYPRVCGGTMNGLSGSACGFGLSPRVRGNRDLGR